jgi:hypothetical protein
MGSPTSETRCGERFVENSFSLVDRQTLVELEGISTIADCELQCLRYAHQHDEHCDAFVYKDNQSCQLKAEIGSETTVYTMNMYGPGDRQVFQAISCIMLTPGHVRIAGGQGLVLADTPFVPEVFLDGAFRPLCLAGSVEDSVNLAKALCAKVGYPYEGHTAFTGHAYEQDAIAVAACGYGESLLSCLDGVHRSEDEHLNTERCKTGNRVGFEVTCHYQCRRFPKFDESYLQTCHRYLDNSTYYYLADTPFIDNAHGPSGFSLVTQIATVIKNVLNPTCTSNIMSLVCRTWFRECKQVQDQSSSSSNQIRLPSLMCRHECERHLEIWDKCLLDLQIDSAAEANFHAQMKIAANRGVSLLAETFFGRSLPLGPDGIRKPMKLLECTATGGDLKQIEDADSSSAWLFGQYPAHASVKGRFQKFWASIDHPVGMTGPMYPKSTSVYTHSDGTTQEVPCFFPDKATEVPQIKCPNPFVNPLAINHIASCIQPCPVQAYTNEEYTIMWGISNGIGLLGFGLNWFMLLTWLSASKGKVGIRNQPLQLVICIIAGILYGIVVTLPSLVMKYELACECQTEECSGSSTTCTINRLGIYLLLSILINLCVITYRVKKEFIGGLGYRPSSKKTLNSLSVVLPILIAAIGYALEVESNDEGENAKLNTVRHAFTCSMRFRNMKTEWLAIWIWFFVFGVLTSYFSLRTVHKMSRALQESRANFESAPNLQSDKSRKRLLRIAGVVSICLVLNTAATLSISVKQEDWIRTANISLTCQTKESWSKKNWENYGLGRGEIVEACSVDEHIPVTKPCGGSCLWYPEITEIFLVCMDAAGYDWPGYHSFEDFAKAKANGDWEVGDGGVIVCDCPCSSLIEIKRPSVSILTLAQVAQNLVVVVVGLNMGFRKENLKSWKRSLGKKENVVDYLKSWKRSLGKRANIVDIFPPIP